MYFILFGNKQEEFNNELELDANCDLTQLILKPAAEDSKRTLQLEYSMATRKHYVHLDMLNSVLIKVRQSGKLEELKQKYWNRKCNAAQREYAAVVVTFFSLAVSLFLLS